MNTLTPSLNKCNDIVSRILQGENPRQLSVKQNIMAIVYIVSGMVLLVGYVRVLGVLAGVQFVY